MVVYWEYAFIGNALPDGLLLYLAVRCARMRARPWRLLLASAMGGAFAVIFPLLKLPVWAAYAVKLLGGVAIALVAASGRRFASYCVEVAAFFALTFAMGGLLTAVYSFFDIETTDGTGFYLERAPVSLVITGFGIFAVLVTAAARAFWKYRRMQRNIFACELSAGECSVRWQGFADSGNCLSFRGEPVCVISAAGAFALFGAHPQPVGRISVGTVNGSRTAPVFRCDALRTGGRLYRGVLLTVGDVGKHFQIILHTALTEGEHEGTGNLKAMAAQPGHADECRALSVRERSAAASAAARRGGGAACQAGSGRRCGDGQGKAHRT